jgi:hypothetical protein
MHTRPKQTSNLKYDQTTIKQIALVAVNLVDAQVWVGADDRAPAEVHALPTEVPPEPPTLALEPLDKATAGNSQGTGTGTAWQAQGWQRRRE